MSIPSWLDSSFRRLHVRRYCSSHKRIHVTGIFFKANCEQSQMGNATPELKWFYYSSSDSWSDLLFSSLFSPHKSVWIVYCYVIFKFILKRTISKALMTCWKMFVTENKFYIQFMVNPASKFRRRVFSFWLVMWRVRRADVAGGVLTCVGLSLFANVSRIISRISLFFLCSLVRVNEQWRRGTTVETHCKVSPARTNSGKCCASATPNAAEPLFHRFRNNIEPLSS